MSTATLLLFILASAVAIVTPGPTVLLAMSNGSRHGVRTACWGMAVSYTHLTLPTKRIG